MYDTKFFMNTFALKQRIINWEFSSEDRDRIIAELSSSTAPSPFVSNIETTNHCNMSCMMCQRPTDFRQTLRHMDSNTFNATLSQIDPQDGADLNAWQDFVETHMRINKEPSENNFYYDVVSRSITLHGFGEPLLDPKLPERIAAMTQRNIPSYFSCNPCNIRLDFIRKLFESGTGYIKFAIDSLDDEKARAIRGKNADFTKSYQKVLEVLELKKEMRAETVIILTMLDFSGNDKMQADFLDLWKGKDVYAYVKSVDNNWLLDKKDDAEQTGGANKSHYKKQYCEYAWSSVTVLADGSVVPCTQDINGTWVFGNVKEQSLQDIWNSDKYREFRELQVSKDFPEDFMCHSKCDLDIIAYYFNDYEK